MKINEIYNLFLKCDSFSTDTRDIGENSMFFALKGENFNANKFADEAIKNGASYVIIDEIKYKTSDRHIIVNDVLKTLQELANFHRKEIGLKIIAITGTNGKTTTKELLNAVLKEKYSVKATAGNYNNHIGVPLTLLGFDKSLDFGIVEMGANHQKEIELLCKIAEPDYGIITNIGKAHIEGFGSFKGVIKTKNELYDYLKANNKTIFYRYDNDILRKLVGDYKNTIPFSFSNATKYFCQITDVTPFVNIKFFNNDFINITTNLVGVYNLENMTAACSIAAYFTLSNQQIKTGLEKYLPSNNRSQFTKTKSNEIIIDAYNANPTSMNGAIDSFVDIKSDNKVLILGDMLELGGISDEEHKNIIKKIEELGFENVFFVGEIFYQFKTDNFNFFLNTKDLTKYIKTNKIDNAFVLLKGSRGIKLEGLVGDL